VGPDAVSFDRAMAHDDHPEATGRVWLWIGAGLGEPGTGV